MEHCIRDHGLRFFLYCVVVMPDHVHLVYDPCLDTEGNLYPVKQIAGAIKSTSARKVNRLIGRRGSLWMDESFDHVLRRSESIEAKCQYVCMNPVRARLVKKPDEWKWLWRWWIDDPDSARG